MVIPCSRSARRPSVSRARSAEVRPRSRLTRSTAASWSDRTDFVSCRRRPTRVDLPSSTEPAVARRSRVPRAGTDTADPAVAAGSSTGVVRVGALISGCPCLGAPAKYRSEGRAENFVGSSEVALLLAVLHGGLGDPVVGTGRAALGQRRGGHLDDDVGVGAGRGLHGAGARHVADGAVADQARL